MIFALYQQTATRNTLFIKRTKGNASKQKKKSRNLQIGSISERIKLNICELWLGRLVTRRMAAVPTPQEKRIDAKRHEVNLRWNDLIELRSI